jgi:hypothetical protein
MTGAAITSFMISPPHTYEVHPRKDHRGVDLISEVLPFGGLWLQETTVSARIQKCK